MIYSGGRAGTRSIATYPEAVVLLAGGAVDVGEAVLMHDPVGLVALGRLAGVEDESLLDGHRLRRAHRLVCAGGLPVPGAGGAVRPRPVRVLAVPRGEEVPLLLAVQRHPCTDSSSTEIRRSQQVRTGRAKKPGTTTACMHGAAADDTYLGAARDRACIDRSQR
jgi:hypothetical protein